MSPKFFSPPGLANESRRTVGNKTFRDEVTFQKYSSETNGEYTEALVTVAAGGGNPLHYHNTYTETFTPTSGKLGLQLGDEVFHIEKGQTVTIPKTHRHRFFNDSSEPIEFHCTIRPGNPGFEKSIYIAYGLANDGLVDKEAIPTNFFHLCVLASQGDINLAGWAGLFLRPIMALGGWYARWSGIENALLEKYFT